LALAKKRIWLKPEEQKMITLTALKGGAIDQEIIKLMI
jgi:hypothetical protein